MDLILSLANLPGSKPGNGKKGPRRVATAEGAQFYGQPIGTIITADMIDAKKKENASKGVTPSKGMLAKSGNSGNVSGGTPDAANPQSGGSDSSGGAGTSTAAGDQGGGQNEATGQGGNKYTQTGYPAPGIDSTPPDWMQVDEKPEVPQVALGIKPSTISGPKVFKVGETKFDAPEGSKLIRTTANPNAAFVVTPDGQVHLFTDSGEVEIDPMMSTVLQTKFAGEELDDPNYTIEEFDKNEDLTLDKLAPGTELADASGNTVFQKDSKGWKHTALDLPMSDKDLKPLYDSGELTVKKPASQDDTDDFDYGDDDDVAIQFGQMSTEEFNAYIESADPGDKLYFGKTDAHQPDPEVLGTEGPLENQTIEKLENGNWKVPGATSEIPPESLVYLKGQVSNVEDKSLQPAGTWKKQQEKLDAEKAAADKVKADAQSVKDQAKAAQEAEAQKVADKAKEAAKQTSDAKTTFKKGDKVEYPGVAGKTKTGTVNKVLDNGKVAVIQDNPTKSSPDQVAVDPSKLKNLSVHGAVEFDAAFEAAKAKLSVYNKANIEANALGTIADHSFKLHALPGSQLFFNGDIYTKSSKHEQHWDGGGSQSGKDGVHFKGVPGVFVAKNTYVSMEDEWKPANDGSDDSPGSFATKEFLHLAGKGSSVEVISEYDPDYKSVYFMDADGLWTDVNDSFSQTSGTMFEVAAYQGRVKVLENKNLDTNVLSVGDEVTPDNIGEALVGSKMQVTLAPDNVVELELQDNGTWILTKTGYQTYEPHDAYPGKKFILSHAADGNELPAPKMLDVGDEPTLDWLNSAEVGSSIEVHPGNETMTATKQDTGLWKFDAQDEGFGFPPEDIFDGFTENGGNDPKIKSVGPARPKKSLAAEAHVNAGTVATYDDVLAAPIGTKFDYHKNDGTLSEYMKLNDTEVLMPKGVVQPLEHWKQSLDKGKVSFQSDTVFATDAAGNKHVADPAFEKEMEELDDFVQSMKPPTGDPEQDAELFEEAVSSPVEDNGTSIVAGGTTYYLDDHLGVKDLIKLPAGVVVYDGGVNWQKASDGLWFVSDDPEDFDFVESDDVGNATLVSFPQPDYTDTNYTPVPELADWEKELLNIGNEDAVITIAGVPGDFSVDEVNAAINALETHPHSSVKYGVKSLPDDHPAKVEVDALTAAAAEAYPNLKPKPAVIKLLKSKVTPQTVEKHLDGAQLVNIGKEKPTVTAFGKTGMEISVDQLEEAIDVLEAFDGKLFKAQLSKANNPLGDLDFNWLVGKNKDKLDQKKQVITHLKGVLNNTKPVEKVTPESLDTSSGKPTMAQVQDIVNQVTGVEHKGLDVQSLNDLEWGAQIGVKLDGIDDMYEMEKDENGQWHILGMEDEESWSAEDIVADMVHGHISYDPNDADAFYNDGEGVYGTLNDSPVGQQWQMDTASGPIIWTKTGDDNWDSTNPAWQNWANHDLGDEFETQGVTPQPVAKDNNHYLSSDDMDDLPIGTTIVYTSGITGTSVKLVRTDKNQWIDPETGMPFTHEGVNNPSAKKELWALPTSYDEITEHAVSWDEFNGLLIGSRVRVGVSAYYTKTGHDEWTTETSGLEHNANKFQEYADKNEIILVSQPSFVKDSPFVADAAMQANVNDDDGSVLGQQYHDYLPGDYIHSDGKTKLTVYADGNGAYTSASPGNANTGIPTAMPADEIAGLDLGAFWTYQGVPKKATPVKPKVKKAPKPPANLDDVPLGTYYLGSSSDSDTPLLVKVPGIGAGFFELHTNGQKTYPSESYTKTKLTQGKLLDKNGNTAIVPAGHTGSVYLFNNQTTVDSLKQLLVEMNLPHNDGTWSQEKFGSFGVYVDQEAVSKLSLDWYGDTKPASIRQTITEAITSIVGPEDSWGFKDLEGGALEQFSWKAGSGKAFFPDDIAQLSYLDGQKFNAVQAKERIDLISKSFDGTIGRHVGGMSSGQRNEWVTAFYKGDFKTMYGIEVAAAIKQGKSHDNGPAHPGYSANQMTNKINWAPTVMGEKSVDDPIVGMEWNKDINMISADEVNNYLLAANMQNPTHLSLGERYAWVAAHRRKERWRVNALSSIAQQRKKEGASSLTPELSWISDVKPDAVPIAAQAADEAFKPVYKIDPTQTVKKSKHPIFNVSDQFGNKYFFKPRANSKEDKYRSEVAHGANLIGQFFGFNSAKSELVTIDGKYGHLQRDVGGVHAMNGFNWAATNKTIGSDVATEHLLDWMLDQDDTWAPNMRLTGDGHAIGIDKDRAFRHYGEWNGLTPNHGMDVNTSVIYADLYLAIQNKQIDKATADAIYDAVQRRAAKISKSSDQALTDLVKDATKNRESWVIPYTIDGKKVPQNQDGLIAAVLDRKSKLPQQFEEMWKSIYAKAGYGDLPEPKKTFLGEGQHSGVDDPTLHDDAFKVGAAGVSTLVADGGVVGGTVTLTSSKNSDGTKHMNGQMFLAPKKQKSVLSWFQSHSDGTTVSAAKADSKDFTYDDKYAPFLAAAKTVGAHAEDGQYNQSTLQNYENAKVWIKGDQEFWKPDLVGDSDGWVTFPSGQKVNINQVDQYKLMLDYYQSKQSIIDDALAAKTKPAQTITKFEALAVAEGNVVYLDGNGQKLIKLANGEWVYVNSSIVSIVPNSDPHVSEAELGGGSWKLLEKESAKVEKKVVFEAKHGTPHTQSGTFKDFELHLSGSKQQGGVHGTEYEVTLPTGEKIWFRNANTTGTIRSQQGMVSFRIPNAKSAEESATSMERIKSWMNDNLGLSLDGSDHDNAELTYWREMFDVLANRNHKSGSKWAKAKADLDKKIASISSTEASFLEDFDGKASVGEQNQFFRKLWGDHFGHDRVEKMLADEAYLPYYENFDLRHVDTPSGKPQWQRFDVDIDEFKKKDMMVVSNAYSGSHTLDSVKSGGALSTEERLRMLGKWITGKSSGADQGHGSANYVFTRIKPASTHNGFHYVYHPRTLMRTRTYSFNGDNFGELNNRKTSSPSNPVDAWTEFTGGGNETMIPHGTGLFGDLEMIVFDDAKLLNEAIQFLKNLGFEKIRGVPIEDRLVLRLNLASAIAKLKKTWYSN